MIRLNLFLKKNLSRFSSKFNYDKTAYNHFERYHLPTNEQDTKDMLKSLGCEDMEDFKKSVIADDLRSNETPKYDFQPVNMNDCINEFRDTIAQNKKNDCYLGEGFYPTAVPPLVKRCILENPAWYTAYTPYQAEISQGRLESLFNYQVMIKRITQMDFANGSLLDEATAAGESVLMTWRMQKKKKNTVIVSQDVFDSSIELIETYCRELSINVIVGEVTEDLIEEHKKDLMSVVFQTPNKKGVLNDYGEIIEKLHSMKKFAIVGTDLMSCLVAKPPGEMGADIVYGNAQRFGVPLGYGGPHAAFFASRIKYIRQSPGRIIGIAKDKRGNDAYRISLTTREQHIKKERATSNICTAQVLLSNMNFFFALYHGEQGLLSLAKRISYLSQSFVEGLKANGFESSLMSQDGKNYFDTVLVKFDNRDAVYDKLIENEVNAWKYGKDCLRFSFDETKSKENVSKLVSLITGKSYDQFPSELSPIRSDLQRSSRIFKSSDIFNQMKGELEITRYIRRLENKDVTLCNSMIPLGSCTMKLNAAYQLEHLSSSQMDIHPFVPMNQAKGYTDFIKELAVYLLNCTEMDAVSFQSNSGASGEYVGLMAIKKYHESRGDHHRDVVIIPASAHGTNPASAAKMGLKPVTIKTQNNGYIDIDDLKIKLKKFGDRICGLMITYPSTFGVFEENTRDAVDLVREKGGKIYIDGANMNAHFFITSPGTIGDVCHLNLHKSFAIPHGGGGPGHGPVLVKDVLKPFLPTHVYTKDTAYDYNGLYQPQGPMIGNSVNSSSSILSISYLFIKAGGVQGLRRFAEYAILNSNYLRKLLESHYKIYFMNNKGFGAHEFILDINPIKKATGITEEDICKRLMDYGFHAPTQAFPLPGTLMIEPTESENKEELERFANALISIKEEINKVESGEFDKKDNPLKNAPHSIEHLLSNEWKHSYSREVAAYPMKFIRERGKVWINVERIDSTGGDRNLRLDYD